MKRQPRNVRTRSETCSKLRAGAIFSHVVPNPVHHIASDFPGVTGDTSALACCCESLRNCTGTGGWLRATDWLTTSHEVVMFLQPGSLTIILPLTTLCFYFSRVGSRFFVMGRRSIPGRSETGQKHVRNKGWMQDSAHPSTHRPFRLICPKAGSSYCIGKKEDRVEPLHVWLPRVTGLISWKTPALSLAAVSGFSHCTRTAGLLGPQRDSPLGMVLQPGSLTIILLPPATLCFYFSRVGSRLFSFLMDQRGIPGRSETGQKHARNSGGCKIQPIHPPIHPSIHPFGFQIHLSQIRFILHRKSKTGC